jgi:spermidine/putrescine transport system substrate-binding protein
MKVMTPTGKLYIALWPILGALFLAACAGSTSAPTPTAAPETTGTAGDNTVLTVYNWDTYIDPIILENFEEEFGVTVNYLTFEGPEELLANVQAGEVVYDVIVPSDYMVALMRDEGLLQPLRQENIPNLSNLDPDFINPTYDPNNEYCVAYQWGTMGIGYDLEAAGKEIDSWADFFDPTYSGRVALLDDMRNTMGIALIYLGYSPNTADAAEIRAARDFLMSQSGHVVTYAPDSGQDLLLADEVDLALEWSGDIFQAMESDASIRYVIPEEGSMIWTDNMCIPANAANRDMAEAFINYILKPEVGAALSNYIRYATPNEAAVSLLFPADRHNPAIYPRNDVRSRLHFLTTLDSETRELYEQAWTEVLNQQSQ